MTKVWVGSMAAVRKALHEAGADVANGQWVIAGSPINGMLDEPEEPAPVAVEVGPETLYFIKGSPLRLLDLLEATTDPCIEVQFGPKKGGLRVSSQGSRQY